MSASSLSSSGKRLGVLVLILILALGGYKFLMPLLKGGTVEETSVESAPTSQQVKVKIAEKPSQSPAAAPTASKPHDSDKGKHKEPAVTAMKMAKVSGKVDSKMKAEPKTMASQKTSPVRSASVMKKERRKGAGHQIQVGSFLVKNNAETRLKVLKKAGYAASIQEADVFSKHWYRVKVGTYHTRTEANKTAAAIKKKLKMDCFVIGKG